MAWKMKILEINVTKYKVYVLKLKSVENKENISKGI